MRHFIVPAVLLTAVVSCILRAAEPAKPDPGPRDGFVVSKMRVQEFKGTSYFFTTTQTTIAQMSPVVTKMMQDLGAAVGEHSVHVMGAPVFVYKGATGEMDKPFTLEVGFPVDSATKPVGEFKVRELEPMRCATVLFSGPMAQIGQAYQQVFPELFAAGLQPSGESREMHVYWEGLESPNNMVLIQIGLK
ncbi:MAG: hypothetical protein ACREJC_05495 [Tepidisphaeraceae bacterium]